MGVKVIIGVGKIETIHTVFLLIRGKVTTLFLMCKIFIELAKEIFFYEASSGIVCLGPADGSTIFLEKTGSVICRQLPNPKKMITFVRF
jgi:hypothetical protein